jgi:hypothetical protein
MLANAQCSASCFVFGSPGVTEHNLACCTDHCSLTERSKTDSSHTSCQHKHSTLGYAELKSGELDNASSVYFWGGSAPVAVGNAPTAVAEMLSSASIHTRGDLPPGSVGHPFFSVLRI